MKSIWPVVALVLFGGSAPLTNDTIRVQRLELVDAKGAIRGVMTTADKGSPMLTFFDPQGQARAMMGFNPKGQPVLMIGGSDKPGVVLIQASDGSAGVGLVDAKARSRSQMRVSPDGLPSFTMFTEESIPGAKLELEDGEAHLYLGKPDGVSVSIGADSERAWLQADATKTGAGITAGSDFTGLISSRNLPSTIGMASYGINAAGKLSNSTP
jgi:hypothetical protein